MAAALLVVAVLSLERYLSHGSSSASSLEIVTVIVVVIAVASAFLLRYLNFVSLTRVEIRL
jgi:hypothetical protein